MDSANKKLTAYTTGPTCPAGTKRLHLNEFRYEHSQTVKNILKQPLITEDMITCYPNENNQDLVRALARYVDSKESNILIAAGSDEILRAVISTSGLRNHDTLLMGVPGYTHFEHNARLQGLKIVNYAIGLGTTQKDHSNMVRYYHDLMKKGCLVYLCSPNNPTGDMWSEKEVESLVSEYPKSFFLLDEAYVEFASVCQPRGKKTDTEHLNCLSVSGVTKKYSNIVVARTLSKAFGLAGLRIGYAIADEKTIKQLGIAVSPKSFNSISAKIALGVLSSVEHYYRTTCQTRKEAIKIVTELQKNGWVVYDTPGNFYLVYVAAPDRVANALLNQGIQCRNRDDLPCLSGFIRLTAGNAEDTNAVLSAFDKFKVPQTPPIQNYYTSKGTIANIKKLLSQTLAILSANSAEVWVENGSLLGAVRHNGIIPWDNDVDLAYLVVDEKDYIADLVKEFERHNLTLQRNRTNAYWQVGTNQKNTVISPVHIDIFSYTERNGRYRCDDERYRTENPDSKTADCNTSYSHDELFPLRETMFYDMCVKIPQKSEMALTRALGKEYNTMAKIRSENGIKTYSIRDYTPA